MSIFTLVFSNLRYRWLTSLFNVLVLALGIATMVTLLLVSHQLEQRFTRDLQGIDLVVGAKGSPLQLMLSSVFHIDIPTGNIPLSEAEKLSKHPLVKEAIPLALGDSYHGFRIVGTDGKYAAHYGAEFAQGRAFDKPMEAVVGAEVARNTDLKMDAVFAGSHGLSEGGEVHAGSLYHVVGVLQPTGSVIDRLVLTQVASVWQVHAHPHEAGHVDDDGDEEEAQDKPKEITSLLIQYKSPMAAVTMPRQVNATPALQAAAPAFEMARLFQLLGAGGDAVQVFGAVLMGLAGLGFFVTLWSAVHERRYDIALMRSMGASKTKVLALVLAEGLMLGVLGTALGLALGHGMGKIAQLYIEHSRHMTLVSPGVLPVEGGIVIIALAISVVAAMIPAWMAYKTPIARLLAKG